LAAHLRFQLDPGFWSLRGSVDDVIRVVREKAFTPKEARVTAEGTLLSAGVKLHLKVRGTDEIYELTGDAAELKKNVGKGIVNLRASAIDCDQNGSGMWTYRGESRITRGQMPR
jgi:hypothetical protein